MVKGSPKIYVTFWGTRGSISTPGTLTEKYGGNTACVSIQHGETDVILDAGTGIRNLGLTLLRDGPTKRGHLDCHLLLSHTHWDHIQGLPFFSPAYVKGAKLRIYGSPQKTDFLDSILRRQMDLNYFPVEMNQLGADISIQEFSRRTTTMGSFSIDWQEQIHHPGGCVRYRLRADGRKVVYATDVELDRIFGKGQKTRGNKKERDAYLAFIKNAHLLIADGQYTAEQYPYRVGFGHTSIPVLIETAYAAGVKQLAVFHHEPQNSDTLLDSIWSHYAPLYARKKRPMTIFWAREGMTVTV